MLRTLLLFLLFLLIARAIWRLLSGIRAGASAGSARTGYRPASPPAMKMVRDPVCGTYVVPGKALELARGKDTMYFCSEKCRTQWTDRKPA